MSSKFPGQALGVLHGEDKKRNAEHFTEAANPAKRIHFAEFAVPPEPYGSSGGLNLFANKQHCNSKDVPNQPLAPAAEECAPTSPAENPMPAGSPEPTIEPTAEWTCPPIEPDELDIQIALRCETDEELLVWIGLEYEELYAVNCPVGTTIGQLTQAEAKIGCSDHLKAISAVGSELPVSSEVHNCQIVLFRLVKDHQGERCPLYRTEAGFPKLNHLQRTNALWHQQGWVAFDEMTFYMNSINRASNALTTDPLHLHDDPRDQSTIGKWILTAFQTAVDKNTDLTIGTACLWRHHWFPILAQFDGDQMNITTSSEAGRYVTDLLEKAFDSAPPTVIAPIQQRVVPTTWAADCGFQTLAFILKIVHGDHQQIPMPIQEAIEWRVLFAQHLRNYFRHNDMMDSPLGGAPEFARLHDLRNLLEEHGVDKNRSHGVAQHLVQTLGSAALQTILSAPRPWKDLKTRATQHKIQLVTSDELNRQIEQRQKEDKPFGKKATKSTTNKHKPSLQQELVLKADQIKLPEGIWQQSDGTKLAQLDAHQLQMKQRGIAIINFDDAQPYLQLTEPISAEGLALIILDQGSPMPDRCSKVTFPASYVATQEPMIISAFILQLGQMPVTRVMPSNPIAVNEVETAVYRCVVFRDQLAVDWTLIEQRPVKTILSLESLHGLESHQVLDVWDRQHLTKRCQKAKPDQAEIYSATLRVTMEGSAILEQANARLGLYVEPRAQTGRSPHEDYQVVWLPKKDFNETLITKQVTEVPTAIVRSGDRYGLRTLKKYAPAVHSQHRPEVSYLDSAKMKSYKLAPLPYGTTKANLQKVCAEWEWQARPSHASWPRGGQHWHCLDRPGHWIAQVLDVDHEPWWRSHPGDWKCQADEPSHSKPDHSSVPADFETYLTKQPASSDNTDRQVWPLEELWSMDQADFVKAHEYHFFQPASRPDWSQPWQEDFSRRSAGQASCPQRRCAHVCSVRNPFPAVGTASAIPHGWNAATLIQCMCFPAETKCAKPGFYTTEPAASSTSRRTKPALPVHPGQCHGRTNAAHWEAFCPRQGR